jgi:uncharacterized protein (DUF885 family)
MEVAMSNTESHDLDALQRLLADEWDYRVREDPLFATRCGDHRFNDRLPDVSPEAYRRRAAQARLFLERLQAIGHDRLPPEARLNFEFFKREIENQIAEYEFGAHFMPLTKSAGPQADFPDLLNIVPLGTLLDYENYLKRLEGFNRFAQDHIELMRAGMQAGYVSPRVVLSGIAESIQSHIVDDPAQSLFFDPFEHLPAGLGEAEEARLRKAGRAAIVNSVVPGYRSLLEFLVHEYTPAARLEVAASAMPNGRAFYEHRVRKYTSLDLTPRQVHDTGLREVQRIHAEMAEVIRQVGFAGSFREFADFMRNERRFYVDTPAALLQYVALIAKKMDGELPRLFKKLPRTPYGLRPIPDYVAPNTTSAYYFLPTGDGSTAGFYYVNTYDLKSRPLYEYEALSFHEAVPGHHLQFALQLELENAPNFRRFGEATAFTEGWALYAERLGLEVGFYQDPYSNFGRLIFEMWRAARLVVDTGLHYLGWTRQQAIDYMLENTALSSLNITNEVDRYIALPGQALAYKIGELKIRELRASAEQSLGPKFDVREFHDVVLRHGGIPLAVLEANVLEWLGVKRN